MLPTGSQPLTCSHLLKLPAQFTRDSSGGCFRPDDYERYILSKATKTVSQIASTTPINLGFLTVVHEPSGYLGGYLVTNQWSRPLEFRLTSAVQPNRIQQILYGSTLQSYVCADLIAKSLVDRAATTVHCLFTDRE